ncbi:MAG: TIGR04283 family arsenosugar biosynthesis glycosyltransferase [Proteobacteria bacterium]|nr:TIGR04283 family arsenosugar biosynthesis glycosyltransferase [Pseudomonadota bacterium]
MRLAVIVPALNEAVRIGPLLDALSGWDEVVVADGGSTDGTPEIARARGVEVVAAPRGRGPQMNAGVRACGAELLLFLHADTLPPSDAPRLIREALADPTVAGGAFRAAFEGGGPTLRLAAWFTRFETGLTTFGDQGFFMRRSAWAAAGGFPEEPFLEDVDMRRRLKRLGRFMKLESAVHTSARRFEAEGTLRRFALNAWILLLHRLGVRPGRLLRFYRPDHRPHFQRGASGPSLESGQAATALRGTPSLRGASR